jgi:phosphatidylserine/phosphatidylglycerophosphate/cardiolipin synthase-like enzyme
MSLTPAPPPPVRRVEVVVEAPTCPSVCAFEAIPLFDTAYLPALLTAIRDARREIVVSMYVTDRRGPLVEPILIELAAAARRGVAIRALFDEWPEVNKAWAAWMGGMGATVRLDDDRSLLHDKAVLVDERTMLVGNHNWTAAALRYNREASVLLRGPREAFLPWRRRFEKRFERGQEVAAATYTPGPTAPVEDVGVDTVYPATGRLVVDGDYEEALWRLVRAARTDIRAAVFYVGIAAWAPNDAFGDVGEVLAGRVEAGVEADVVLDQMEGLEGGEEANAEAIAWFTERGVRARFDARDVTHHVKAVVADTAAVLIGSHNWTTSSVAYNDEVSVYLESPALAEAVKAYLGTIR